MHTCCTLLQLPDCYIFATLPHSALEHTWSTFTEQLVPTELCLLLLTASNLDR